MGNRVGQQLGNYQLLRLIGQGGFADVYLGEHVHLRTQAAIKVLQFRLGEDNVTNFLNEARTIAHLIHPYIVRVLDYGVQNNTPFLVMDYAPRGTLRQRFLQGQPLPPGPFIPFIKQAAAALQYGHERNVIHRDVKPENMLLGPNDEILLADFGLAMFAKDSITSSPTDTAGTAAYMAPEQLQGHPLPASDQYALGIIAYEWLTGTCPFHGSFFEVASQQVLKPIPPLRTKIPQLPTPIETVIMRALEKNPEHRYTNVKDFALALEEASLIAPQAPFRGTTLTGLQAQPRQGSPTTTHFTPSQPLQNNSGVYHTPQSSGIHQEVNTRTSINIPDTSVIPDRPFPANAWNSQNVAYQSNTGWPFPATPVATPQAAPVPPMQVPGAAFPYLSPTIQTGQGPSQAVHNSLAGLPPLDEDIAAQSLYLAGRSNTNLTLQNNAEGYISLAAATNPLRAFSEATANSTDLYREKQEQPAKMSASSSAIAGRKRTPASKIGSSTIAVIVVAALVVFGSAFGFFLFANKPGASTTTSQQASTTSNQKQTQDQQPKAATATPQVTPTTIAQEKNPYATSGTMVIHDSLQTSTNDWQQGKISANGGSCQIEAGTGYVVVAPIIDPGACIEQSHSYSNFTYEVTMTFTKIGQMYSGGGIVFRSSSDGSQYYYFEVMQDGKYTLQICNAGNCTKTLDGYKLGKAAITAFRTYPGAANTLAVVANNNSFAIFVNGVPVSEFSDATFVNGNVGMMATGGNDQGLRTAATSTPTTAIFTNAKIWALP